MIPPKIMVLLNAWIKNDEWVEEKPQLMEELLTASLEAVRDDPTLARILPRYVLERIEYVRSH